MIIRNVQQFLTKIQTNFRCIKQKMDNKTNNSTNNSQNISIELCRQISKIFQVYKFE